MKKLIFFLSFLITANIIFAQAPSNRSGSFVTAVDQFTRVNQLFGLPIVSDTLVFTGTNGLDSVGSKIYVRSGVNVGEWIREYDGVSQNKWVKVGSGGGGSGCTTFYVTSDSLYFVRDSCGTLDSTQIVGDGSGGSGVQSVTGNIVDNTDPANPVVTGISQSQLDDTSAAIRADIPAQFNPIAGTNMSLSGTYPNITFNASGGSAGATGVDSTNTATSAGQTVFTFPYTLTDYTVEILVTRNGVTINPSDYTVNTGDVTFTGFTCDSGDKIRFIGIK